MTYSAAYELVQVAHSDNLSFDEFALKPEWYRDMILESYRTKNQIEAVLYEDQKMKDEQRRAEQEAIRLSGGLR